MMKVPEKSPHFVQCFPYMSSSSMALQPESGLGLPFVMVRYLRCGVISPTINLVLVILIRPAETSGSKANRHLVAKQVKHG
jgi:hypothetical protein